MKQPYIQFYVGDWIKDPELSMCSPATRGIWLDLICRIHELQRDGKLVATLRQMSVLCRCTEQEATEALSELKTTRTADVYEENGAFTVICRRIERAHNLSRIRSEVGSKGAANTIARREQNPDIDSEDDGLNKVREFARGEGIVEKDADWFFWKGRGNGWTNGGKPMKDWRATLRSWNRAGYLPSQKNSGNGQRPTPFQRPKEAAPVYDKLPPMREPTEAELVEARRIAAEEKEKLRKLLTPA